MDDKNIKIRVRLIIIKNNKILKPKTLTEKILTSYQNGFSNDTEYVGVIE